jgi:hypothetical protein
VTDRTLRALEREAATGDRDALVRLGAELLRSGQILRLACTEPRSWPGAGPGECMCRITGSTDHWTCLDGHERPSVRAVLSPEQEEAYWHGSFAW